MNIENLHLHIKPTDCVTLDTYDIHGYMNVDPSEAEALTKQVGQKIPMTLSFDLCPSRVDLERGMITQKLHCRCEFYGSQPLALLVDDAKKN